MLSPLRHPTFRPLFAAKVLALVATGLGTGLATVALGLLAWLQAGAVLGTALAITMAAQVTLAPIAALTERLPRLADRPVMIGSQAGLSVAALIGAGIGALGLLAVLRLWPAQEARVLPHAHPDQPHLMAHTADPEARHAHAIVIDDLHRSLSRML